LKNGPIGCPETSVNNCQSAPRNIPQERRCNPYGDCSRSDQCFIQIR